MRRPFTTEINVDLVRPATADSESAHSSGTVETSGDNADGTVDNKPATRYTVLVEITP